MKLFATTTGVAEAIGKVRGLADKAKRGAKRGVTKANKLALAAAKATLTRNRTGLLRKSLGDKVSVNGDVITGVVGPRRGFRTTIADVQQRTRGAVFVGMRGRKATPPAQLRAIKLRASKRLRIGQVIDPAKYGRFVESGHERGGGHSRAPAYPFIRPAADRVRQSAEQAIASEISAAVRGS